MPTISCQRRTLTPSAWKCITDQMLAISPESTLRVPVVGRIDEITHLLERSRQHRESVCFQDDGFPRISVVWRWLASDAGIAGMMVDGSISRACLMLAGADVSRETDAMDALRRVGIAPGNRVKNPALFQFSAEYDGDDAGAELLGLLLFAPFCEVCGLGE